MEQNTQMPILIPLDQDFFWNQVRMIIREEIGKLGTKPTGNDSLYQTNGLVQKPLYKISEVCKLFDVSRPTIYDWIKHGKLKPFKVRSRVYFLFSDIQQLLVTHAQTLPSKI